MPLRACSDCNHRTPAPDDGVSLHRMSADVRERVLVERRDPCRGILRHPRRPRGGGAQETGAGSHYFCGYNCKSWMFTRPERAPAVNVRPTMLENAEWSTPFIETFTSERLPWATNSARYSFASFPAWGEFENLTREFSKMSASRGLE